MSATPYGPSGCYLADGTYVDNAWIDFRALDERPHVVSHEVGHWMGLMHLWGLGPQSQYFGDDDLWDTPPQNSGVSGPCNSPTYNVENIMNYSDPCVEMFTKMQEDKMVCVLYFRRQAMVHRVRDKSNCFCYYGTNNFNRCAEAEELPREPIPGKIAEVNTMTRLYAHPNPFNPSTRIKVTLEREEHIEVAVYDMTGRKIAVLHQGIAEAGKEYSFTWDADVCLPEPIWCGRKALRQRLHTRCR